MPHDTGSHQNDIILTYQDEIKDLRAELERAKKEADNAVGLALAQRQELERVRGDREALVAELMQKDGSLLAAARKRIEEMESELAEARKRVEELEARCKRNTD